MNQHTAGNRPEPSEGRPLETEADETHPAEPESAPAEAADSLDEIEIELDRLAELDPAESVPILAEITAGLNREIDADQESS